MPDGDVFECSVDQTLAGQNITNVYHFIQVGSDGSGDARSALRDMWNFFYKVKFLDCVVTDVALVQARIRRISPTQTQTLTSALTGSGDIGVESLPSQSCAILRCYAIPSGRKGTGHVKLSGIANTLVAAGRISASLLAIIRLYGQVMETDHADAGSGFVFRQVVWSIVDSVAREIVQARPTGVVKTVHSRQIGVGD